MCSPFDIQLHFPETVTFFLTASPHLQTPTAQRLWVFVNVVVVCTSCWLGMKCAFDVVRYIGIDVACLEGFCLVAFRLSDAVAQEMYGRRGGRELVAISFRSDPSIL